MRAPLLVGLLLVSIAAIAMFMLVGRFAFDAARSPETLRDRAVALGKDASDAPRIPRAAPVVAVLDPEARRASGAEADSRRDVRVENAPDPRSGPVDPEAARVRASLARAIDQRLPRVALSATELDAAADATLRIGRAQRALRALPDDPAHASERAQLRGDLEEAIGDFTYVLEMSPAEFARRVQDGTTAAGVPVVDVDADVLLRPLAPRGAEE